MLTTPFAQYPHCRRVGNLLYLAGQGCRIPETNAYCGLLKSGGSEEVIYDVAAQTRGVFDNVDRALAQFGLTKHHLVDVTVFLVDLQKDFAAMNLVWNEYFAEVPLPPVRTTVGVKLLPGMNFVEMKAVAVIKLEDVT
jgi:2-aminomuconate deaminase